MVGHTVKIGAVWAGEFLGKIGRDPGRTSDEGGHGLDLCNEPVRTPILSGIEGRCALLTWVYGHKDLDPGRPVSNDTYFLVFQAEVFRPVCSVREVALEGLKTGNARPFPVAVASYENKRSRGHSK